MHTNGNLQKGTEDRESTGAPPGMFSCDLFRFASDYVWMEERWRSLMRNFYPLKEAVESELGQEVERSSEVGSEANEDSTGLPSLLSRIWGFISH